MECYKFLVVDDEKVSLQAIKMLLLHNYHCTVDVVSSVAEALNRLYTLALEWQPKWYDLVFMDINMPVMQGDLLSKVMRETEKSMQSTPIVAITGGVSEAQRQRFAEFGIHDVVFKPLTLEKLDVVIKKYLKCPQ